MSYSNDTHLIMTQYFEGANYKNAADHLVPMMNGGIPLFQESCVPMQEWQMAYYPNCNSLHSLDLTDLQQLLGVGSARMVWKLGGNDNSVALKTTKIHQVQARKSLYESWRIDALLSERLTSSPRVLDIYGHCGLSTLNQVGTIRPEWYKQHHQSPFNKAALALQLSRAFADVHSIDGNAHVTAVWCNGKPENVLFVDGKLRITDFDESILLWRQHNETLCKFHSAIRNPKRFQAIELCSPNNELDEKVDIYSLGAMLYCILVGRRPYDQIRHFQLKRDGILPDFPPNLGNDTLTEALQTIVIQCMSHDPSTRPTARQVVRELEKALLDEI
jgi:serine/threonine protein kinase